MENHIHLGQVSEDSIVGSRVFGEVNNDGHGVSESLGAETVGVNEDIDLEKSHGVSVEAINSITNETPMENHIDSGQVTGASLVESRVLGEVKNDGYGVFEGFGADKMEVLNKEIDSEKVDSSAAACDQREKKMDNELIGGEKGNNVVEGHETCSGDVLVEALRDEVKEKKGKMKSEESYVMGIFGHVGNGATITNDGFVSGLKVQQIEKKGDNVLIGGQEVDEIVQVPETCSADVPIEVDETEGKIKSEGSKVTGVSMYAGNGACINLVVDLNARHGAYEETLSGNGIVNKETGVKEPLLDGGVDNGGLGNKGVGSNGNQDAVAKKQMTDARLQYEEGNNFKVVARRDQMRGKECQTEKEGEYYLSDLVWGKVRSHHWWPGQIFEPSAASEKAIKHFKKECYLIAYFGDQTFAWNEGATIKPFHVNFTRMEKKSNSHAFCHAVDCALAEVSRRVEFGLSCSCLPEKHRAKIKSQIVVNTGIREEASKRDGGDIISNAVTFQPAEVLQHLKSLAVAPHSGIGRLTFVTTRAQLLVFNRWKGNCNDGLLEKCADEVMEDKIQCFMADGEVSSEVIKSVVRDSSSRKRKHGSGNDEGDKKKAKCVTDMVSGSSTVVQIGEKRKRGRKRGSLSSGNKCKAIEAADFGDSKLRRRKRVLSPKAQKEYRLPKKFKNIGECVRRAVLQVARTTSALESGPRNPAKSGKEKLNNIPPPEEMLSKLCLAASDPMEGYSSLCPLLSLFSDFRNSVCLQNTNVQHNEQLTKEYNGGETSRTETIEKYEFEGTEDSYWTDRIIQSNPDQPVLFKQEKVPDETTPVVEIGNIVNPSPNMDNKQESRAGDLENSAVLVGGSCGEYSPTTFTLKFSDLESVPSVTELNKIFSHYGPLDELQTKVMSKTNRVHVVFKRRADAETAFSSAGKFSIFGPSLLSYRLQPTPRKATSASKRKGKSSKSAKSKLQFGG